MLLNKIKLWLIAWLLKDRRVYDMLAALRGPDASLHDELYSPVKKITWRLRYLLRGTTRDSLLVKNVSVLSIAIGRLPKVYSNGMAHTVRHLSDAFYALWQMGRSEEAWLLAHAIWGRANMSRDAATRELVERYSKGDFNELVDKDDS